MSCHAAPSDEGGHHRLGDPPRGGRAGDPGPPCCRSRRSGGPRHNPGAGRIPIGPAGDLCDYADRYGGDRCSTQPKSDAGPAATGRLDDGIVKNRACCTCTDSGSWFHEARTGLGTARMLGEVTIGSGVSWTISPGAAPAACRDRAGRFRPRDARRRRRHGAAERLIRDVLGLPVVAEDPSPSRRRARPAAATCPPSRNRPAAPISVSAWAVDDIEAVVERARRARVESRTKGIERDERRIWTAPGGVPCRVGPRPGPHDLSPAQPPS